MDIAKDKLKHFFVGNIIALFVINGAALLNMPAYYGFMACVAGFLVFEWYQGWFDKGQPSLLDWAYGVAGALTILLTKLL